jgi:PAS domain S-box-containing protein
MARITGNRIRWLPLGYLIFGLAWVLGSDYVLARVFKGDEAQLLIGSALKGVVFVVLTAALIHLALVFGLSSLDAPRLDSQNARHSALGPILAVVLTLALISASAYMVVTQQIAKIRADAAVEIESAAAIRASQVEAWYQSRLGVMEDVEQSPFTGAAIRQWLADPSPDLDGKLDGHLEAIRRSANFLGVRLYDPSGRPLKSAGVVFKPDGAMRHTMMRAAAGERSTLTDLRVRPDTGRLVLDVVAPLLDDDGPNAVVAGLIVGTGDAGDLLAGLGTQLQGDRRFEALLARRVGDTVQLVTTKAGPPHMPAVPVVVELRKVGAASQVLGGVHGAFEGSNQFGVPVIAVGVPARGTPWHVVVTRDLSIITNPVLKLLSEAIGLAVLSVAVAVTLVLLWWHADRRRAAAEMRRATARAMEMEARLGWASDFANDIILLLDADGRLLDVNERATTAYGYTRAELLAKNVRDLRRDDAATVAAFNRQFATTLARRSLIFETEHIRRDGSTFPVEISSRRVEHAGTTYIQSIVRDITERRQHETMIRLSESRYRTLFEAVPHPICVFEQDTLRILMVNATAEELYGYDREEFVGMSIADLVAPHELERMRRYIAATERLPRQAAGVWQHIGKDGSTIEVDVVSHLVVVNGREARVVVGTDVTERVCAERTLAASEERYRMLFESIPHPMWVFNSETLRFLMVNDAAIAHYGYSRAEFLGMTIADIRPAEDVARLRDHIATSPAQALQDAGIWKHRCRDGRLIDVEIVFHALAVDGRQARLVLAHDVTRRLEIERAMRSSEERYRNLFEEVNDGIVQLHPDNRFMDANAEAARMFGYGRDELLAIGLEDVLDESDHARLAAVTRDTMSAAAWSPPTQRWLLRRRDGSRFAAKVSTRGLADGSVIATIHDLTDMLTAQRKIEHHRDLYDLLSQCTRLGARLAGRKELFDDVVRLSVEKGHFLFAWVGELRQGGGVWPIASAGDDHGHLTEARRGIETGAPISGGALQAILLDGQPVVVNDTALDTRDYVRLLLGDRLKVRSAAALPIRTGGQVTHGLMLYASEPNTFEPDIVRTLAEMTANVSFAIDVFDTGRELDESRNLFQSIINASDTPIYAYDLEGRTLFLNQSSALAFGIEPGAAVGRKRSEYLPPEFERIYSAHDQRVLSTAQPLVIEEGIPGRDRTYLSTIFPLRDIEGRIYGIGGVAADISELRRAQNALADANAGLEQKVAERTQALAAAKDRAETADRAKSVFLSSVSHELRSPLHSIIGFNSVLLDGIDGELNATQLEHLRIVQESSQHLLSIINDLLDVSKIEAGAMPIDARSYRPQEVLRRISRTYGIQAAAKQLDFRLEADLGDLTMIGDERRVEQVVGNLVSNAIKYTFAGGVTVRAGVGDRQLFVDVADTGIGISNVDQRKLFRHFTQLDPGRGRLVEGTGLGLAIAHGLAEAMGGTLAVRSEVDMGSTFSLVLPIQDAARSAA